MEKFITYIGVAAIVSLLCVSVSAQERKDSLYFVSGEVKAVTVVGNSDKSVECKYEGDDFITTINKSSLYKIVFRSGRTEMCNKKFKATGTKSSSVGESINIVRVAGVRTTISFQPHIYSSAAGSAQSKGWGLSATVGYQFNEHLFVGGGLKTLRTDTEYYGRNLKTYTSKYSALPIFASLKFNFLKTRINPYFGLNGGISVLGGDVYANPEFGFDVKLGAARRFALNLSAGGEFLRGKGTMQAGMGDPYTMSPDPILIGYFGIGFSF